MATARRGNATRQITPRQLEILTRIRDHQRSHGYSPTMQELADALGISKVTVFEHVDTLVRKGLLRRSAHRARSLEVTGAAQFPDERPTLLPLVGRIAAGLPLEAVENPETLDLEEVFASNADTFVLRVRGDSMIDEQIRDGDYVVVERRNTARNGDTVVALLPDGEATLKTFYREKDRIRLQPANDAFEPIYADRVDIQGIVIGVIRRL
ncbi:MAG: transcriptional repressor LexA [Phycisphaerales bacterium]|nr:transcriptional repressor LexA [Phycisphaerales bacterium]